MPLRFPKSETLGDGSLPLLLTIDTVVDRATKFLEEHQALYTDAARHAKASEDEIETAIALDDMLTERARMLVKRGGKTDELIKITSLCEKLGLIYQKGEFFTKRGIIYPPHTFQKSPAKGIQVVTAMGARLLLHRANWNEGEEKLDDESAPIRCTYALRLGFNVTQDDYKKFIGRDSLDLGWTFGLTTEQLTQRVEDLINRGARGTVNGKIFGTWWRCYEAYEYLNQELKDRHMTIPKTDGGIILITDLEDSIAVTKGKRPNFSTFPGLEKIDLEKEAAATYYIGKANGALCTIIGKELEVEMERNQQNKLKEEKKKQTESVVRGSRPNPRRVEF